MINPTKIYEYDVYVGKSTHSGTALSLTNMASGYVHTRVLLNVHVFG